MNGINYSSLMGNTGLFANQTSNDEVFFRGTYTGAAKKAGTGKAADNKQKNADSDTYEYSGQARDVKAGYSRPRPAEPAEEKYKALDSNGVQEGIELSDKAKNLLKELRDKYGDMDIAVAEWSTDEEQDYYAGKSKKAYSVLINPELLEKMAADGSVREKYESVLGGAGEKFDTLKKELGEDADKIKGFSITMDQDGNVSYAVRLLKDMTQNSKTQAKSAAQKQKDQAEEKRAERKQAEKDRQEKIVEKRQETEKIEAGSIEDLIAAIKAKLHPEQAGNAKASEEGQDVTAAQAVTE